MCEEEASSVSQSRRQWRPALERLCRVSDEQAAFVRVRSSGSHDSLAAECSEECPDRLCTDKHVMDSLCDTDAVQGVSPGPSLVSVRPLFPL